MLRRRAMALVHEMLYRSGNFASLNMRDYLNDLMTSLLRTVEDEIINAMALAETIPTWGCLVTDRPSW